MTEFDSPWKESLERFFEPFMALAFPDAHKEIAWERGYAFLDKELQQITREAEIGARRVDKLIQVWTLDGGERWLLLHVEVQVQEDPAFRERMFVYHYRIFDRFHRQVVSLAVLADDAPDWRPETYTYGLWGCEMTFRFPVVKLLDYRRESGLIERGKGNPFGLVVEAHLLALETRKDWELRLRSKFQLVKRLYEEGYGRQEIVDLFRFIDWVMDLPEVHERLFWEELSQYEEAKKMPYVTSVERIGIEKGIQQGIQQGIQEGERQGMKKGVVQGLLKGISLALELRFGSSGLDLMPMIGRIEDAEGLTRVMEGVKAATDLDAFKALVLDVAKAQ